MTKQEWLNWSGGMRCEPSEIVQPESEDGVVETVRRAAAGGRQVRVFGTGHSSMPLVATDDTLMNLDLWQGVESHDPGPKRAWIRSGTKLHRLGEELFALGLAMENLGDVDVQALGGAVGTGTHGTGPTMSNISSRVTGVRLVNGAGDVVEIGEGDRESLLAARVAVGALGVFTAIELQLVPVYRLEERTWRAPTDVCIDSLAESITRTRHFEFFWLPPRDACEMKSLQVTDDPVDVLGNGDGLGEFSEGGRRRCGWSHQIIPNVRELKFHEMEYALPAEAGPECFRQVRERMQTRWPHVAWPVEYRTLRADDAYLSPAHGRDTVTISIHQDARLTHLDFFHDIEAIFRAHEGRTHWGKVNTQTGRELAGLYPKWDAFRAVRRSFDPHGTFLNEYLRGLFEAG